MDKKYIRIVLSLTVLMPIWAFVLFGMFALGFPGVMAFLLGFLSFMQNLMCCLFQSNTHEEKIKYKEDMKEAIEIMFMGFIVPAMMFNTYIETGKLKI